MPVIPTPPSTAPMLSASRYGPHLVVTLSGELDVATVAPLSHALDALTDTDRPDLLVDLRAVTFLDGRTITALARAHARALARAGDLRLICVDTFILFILRLPELTPRFDILDTLPSLTPTCRPHRATAGEPCSPILVRSPRAPLPGCGEPTSP
jgi:anti-sigma B factor antagonist